MSFTICLLSALVAVFIAGVAACLLREKGRADRENSKKIALPAIGCCILSLAGFALYVSLGYGTVASLAGLGAAEVLFVLCQIAAPVAGTTVCGVYCVRQRFRLSYFLLAWLNLVLAILGLGAWGLARM